MNKKVIIIIGAALLILSTAAVVVGGAGGAHPAPIDWASRRGQDSYYAPEPVNYDLKDISVNIKGTEAQRYVSVGITVAYRIGPEIADAKAAFTKAESDLRDRLTLLLSNKSLADLEGLENKRVLKQEILDQVEHAVFPDKTGRVEEIYFRQFLIQ
jgi:flagellar basal body-associated protein FliL